MADNVDITAGSGTTIATDDVSGVQYQRVKLDVGGNGASVPVTDAAPLPVSIATPLEVSLETSQETILGMIATQTRQGALTETAPATDTASSGLNGRLQRIAQRLSSLIALMPAALGSGGGLKIDGSGTTLPVTETTLLHSLTGAVDLDGRTIVAMSSYGTAIDCTMVRVKSILGNGEVVYVGNSAFTVGVGVSPLSDGYELEPGESVDIAASDVRDVYAATIQGATAVVCWNATVRDSVGWKDPQ